MVKKSEPIEIDGKMYVSEEHHIEETTELLTKVKKREEIYDRAMNSNKLFEEAAVAAIAESNESKKSVASAHNQNKWLGLHNLTLRRALEELYKATEDPSTGLRNSQEAVNAYGVLHSTPHKFENRAELMDKVCIAAVHLMKTERARYESYTNRQAIEIVENKHEKAWDEFRSVVEDFASFK